MYGHEGEECLGGSRRWWCTRVRIACGPAASPPRHSPVGYLDSRRAAAVSTARLHPGKSTYTAGQVEFRSPDLSGKSRDSACQRRAGPVDPPGEGDGPDGWRCIDDEPELTAQGDRAAGAADG